MNDNHHIPSGYKPSPLGPIPEDWEVKRLGEIGDFSKGNGVPKDKIIKDKHRHPCLTYGDLYTKYDFVIKDIKSFIDNDVASESKEIHIGDICFAGSGETPEDIGKCAAYIEERTAFAGGDIIILSPNKGINSIWLSYVLNSDIGGKQRYKSAQGFSIVHIYPDNLKRIQIPTPILKEQQRIVSVLSLWDTAIEKQTALIEQLALRKHGLMQQLLTGKKRLKGFEGEGEWKRIKAGEIFKSISVKGNGSEVLLSATQEHGVIPRDQLEGRVTMPTGDTNSFKLVEVGDFVISLRSFQGGLEYSEHRGIVSPAYTVLKPIVEIDKSFYRYYFKSAEFIGHLAIAVIGIRDGKQISYEDFCFVKIPYPNIEEQKAISTVLLQSDKEIEIQKQKLAAMQEQKKGLMQVLLTGKKRIN